jgi:hypothetical protein
MAKNGQNGSIKMLMISKTSVFLHHTSPDSYLEHGPNHFFFQKFSPQKLTPLLGSKMAKISQNGPIKMLMIAKTYFFCITLAPNLP